VSDTITVEVDTAIFVIWSKLAGCSNGGSEIRLYTSQDVLNNYTFHCDPEKNIQLNSTYAFITELFAGIYNVWIESPNGCTVYSETFVIPEIDTLAIQYTVVDANNFNCDNGNINITIIGGIPPYDISWNDYYTGGLNRPNVPVGVYILTITDANNCTQTVNIVVSCSSSNKRVMPSQFITPNDDGKNDFLKIENIEFYPNNRVIIFNAYGEEVARITNYNNTTNVWNGKNKHGRFLPDGTYYYIVEIEGEKPIPGWLLMKLSQHR
jgi:gliding motility-associated-like protein